MNTHSFTAVPKQVQSFCFALLLGYRYGGLAPKDWVTYAVNTLDRETTAAAREYINSLNEHHKAPEQLLEFWETAAADASLHVSGDLVAFLKSLMIEIPSTDI